MSTTVARRRARTARRALGHPFGLGLGLGVGLFALLWVGGLLSEARHDAVPRPAPSVPIDPRVEPTARALPAPASPWPEASGSTVDVPRMAEDDPGAPRPALSPSIEDVALLRLRKLTFPVQGGDPRKIRDDFGDPRTGHSHEALDILAPRGTPVLAVDDGVVQRLFTSVRGGLTVYHFDPEGAFCYYYAHLDRYADGLREGQKIAKGGVIGYVGTTGNSPPQTPHLHFGIFKLGPQKEWWKGEAINPFPVWREPVRAD